MQEIWKDVKGYDGIYQVSNLGNVKSLDRIVKRIGNRGSLTVSGKILTKSINNARYEVTTLSNNGKCKQWYVHQLVAIAFKNHNPNGYMFVVNHIDGNRGNNNIDNLEIITQRENTNKKHLNSSSKYTGVSWCKNKNKWRSSIQINGIIKHLGYFTNEHDAHLAYQKKLSMLCSM